MSVSTGLVNTYVDLIVMQRSCSSFRVSVNRVSPALDEAMMPALLTRESVNVDLPWSTCAITDMLRMFFFLSMISRISSIVKFTYSINTNMHVVQCHKWHDHRKIGIPVNGGPKFNYRVEVLYAWRCGSFRVRGEVRVFVGRLGSGMDSWVV